jgi:predicted component of type VI protein secretion system
VPTRKKRPTSFTDALYQSGPEFDFYQAVRLLELLHHDPAEPTWAAVEDVARFRAHQSLNFPSISWA